MRASKKMARNTVAAALAMCAAIMLVAAPVGLHAQPAGDIASKSQQAAQVAQEINALDKEMSVQTEAYNRVKIDLDAITDKVEVTQKRLSEIQQSLKTRRNLLNGRAASMYKNGRTSMLEVLLKTKDFSEFLERADYMSRVARNDAELVDRIKSTRDSVQLLDRQLNEQRRQQQGLVEQSEAKRIQVETKLGERQTLLNGLNQDIQRMLASEQQAQRAGDEALNHQAEDYLSTIPNGAVAKAGLRYLGVVYHWAGAGPGKCPTGVHSICFDCSGLTMYVYKLYGIDIPHNAAMQFNRGIKIPLSQARPGDLVYFGSPPHHCGMYLGNDMFLHAPQTGDVVKVSRLSSRHDVEGLCRFSK